MTMNLREIKVSTHSSVLLLSFCINTSQNVVCHIMSVSLYKAL